jgi:hypothetical protein
MKGQCERSCSSVIKCNVLVLHTLFSGMKVCKSLDEMSRECLCFTLTYVYVESLMAVYKCTPFPSFHVRNFASMGIREAFMEGIVVM